MPSRARRGLSEIMGALVLILIFASTATVVVMLQEEAARNAKRTIETAYERASIALNPPQISLLSRNGKALLLVLSGSPLKLDYVVVYDGHNTSTLKVEKRLDPGSPLEVELGECRRMKVYLIFEPGVLIAYPSNGSWAHCGAAIGRPGGELSDPVTGERLIVLPLQTEHSSRELYRYRVDVSLYLRGLMGRHLLNVLEANVNGQSTQMSIDSPVSRDRIVVEHQIDNRTLLRLVWRSEGNVSVLYVVLEPTEPGTVYVYNGTVNASLRLLRAYYSLDTRICIDGFISTVLSYPLAPWVHSGSAGGSCSAIVNGDRGTIYASGIFYGQAVVEGVGPIVLATPRPVPRLG